MGLTRAGCGAIARGYGKSDARPRQRGAAGPTERGEDWVKVRWGYNKQRPPRGTAAAIFLSGANRSFRLLVGIWIVPVLTGFHRMYGFKRALGLNGSGFFIGSDRLVFQRLVSAFGFSGSLDVGFRILLGFFL